eukprot:COSAG02_NODE_35_length_49339_cov_20.375102_5_plen_60_part_00
MQNSAFKAGHMAAAICGGRSWNTLVATILTMDGVVAVAFIQNTAPRDASAVVMGQSVAI